MRPSNNRVRDDEGATALVCGVCAGPREIRRGLAIEGRDPWGRHVNTRCTALHAACSTIIDRRAPTRLAYYPSGAPGATRTQFLFTGSRVAHDDEIYGENDKDPQQTSRRGPAST